MTLYDELNELKKDNTSGSSQLLEKMKYILINTQRGGNDEKFKDVLKGFIDLWPLFPVIHHFVRYILKESEQDRDLKNLVNDYEHAWENSEEKVAENLYRHVDLNNRKLVLHSQSGMIIKVLTYLYKNHDVSLRIFQTESRPAFEGREQASRLSEYFQVTLFPEADILRVVEQCDMVMSGADVIGDEFFINKTGTRLLYDACKKFSIPFILLGDSRKLVNNPASNYQSELNKNYSPLEIRNDLPSDIKVINRYFEEIPLQNVKIFLEK